jgi:hypothetical protein
MFDAFQNAPEKRKITFKKECYHQSGEETTSYFSSFSSTGIYVSTGTYPQLPIQPGYSEVMYAHNLLNYRRQRPASSVTMGIISSPPPMNHDFSHVR